MLTLPGKYDLATVHSIINTAMVVHVSFSPAPNDPYPAIVPMIGITGSYDRPSADLDEPLDCYGYVSSRIINLSRTAASTSSWPSDSKEEPPKGLPVWIAASKVDCIALAPTPNSHSYNYRSGGGRWRRLRLCMGIFRGVIVRLRAVCTVKNGNRG